MELDPCKLSGHYYLFDTDQSTDPKIPAMYYQNKYYVKCKRCGYRILITDLGNGL